MSTFKTIEKSTSESISCIYLRGKIRLKLHISVHKVIFLQAAEFSLVRLKNYESDNKNILGLSVVLELKVENCTLGVPELISTMA